MVTAAPVGGCGRLAEGHPAFGRSRNALRATLPQPPWKTARQPWRVADRFPTAAWKTDRRPWRVADRFPTVPTTPTTTTSIVRTIEISCRRQPP